MRFFRLISITVLLLACVVLGSACAGAKGDIGPKGDPGADGVGVENIVNNGDGTFTVNLSSGESYTTDNLTGPQGEKGDKGDTGAQGIQGPRGIEGPAGPNMIVAMGTISNTGTILNGYNVDTCTWVSTHYEITLTDISYSYNNLVTMVTPSYNAKGGAGWGSSGGLLHVYIYDQTGATRQDWFSFMVLDPGIA